MRPDREQERQLFRDLAEGRVTKHYVVESYLWLIPMNVSRFGSRWREDLEQECVIALYRAVDLFDIERGLRFSTYSSHWLKQACHAWLYDHATTVRIPVYMRKAMHRVSRGDDCSDLNEATIERAQRLNEQTTVSANIEDVTLEDDAQPSIEELPGLLKEAMKALSKRERRFIEQRFGAELTLREIGEKEGVSIERVRQIVMRALDKMKTPRLKELL